MTMKNEPVVDGLKRRYQRLTARVAKLGPVLHGTIAKRTIVRDDPANPKGQKTYGPYFQWTRKRGGKTVTVNLSASQATAYQNAIDNHRKLEDTLQEMRELSLAILENTTKGVRKRSRND